MPCRHKMPGPPMVRQMNVFVISNWPKERRRRAGRGQVGYQDHRSAQAGIFGQEYYPGVAWPAGRRPGKFLALEFWRRFRQPAAENRGSVARQPVWFFGFEWTGFRNSGFCENPAANNVVKTAG